MMIKGIARHSYSVPLFHFSIIPFSLPIPRRYRKIKCRALVGVVLRQKTPAMSLDDGPADGQPHAEPVALGGVKRLKDLVEILTTYARAAVAHHDAHHGRPVHCRPHADLALIRRTILHGFESVEQQ